MTAAAPPIPGRRTQKQATAERRIATLTRVRASVWADVAVYGTLAIIAPLGFAPAFGRLGYLVAGVGGLAVGSAVAIAGVAFRLPVVTTVLVGVAVPTVGNPVVGVGCAEATSPGQAWLAGYCAMTATHATFVPLAFRRTATPTQRAGLLNPGVEI